MEYQSAKPCDFKNWHLNTVMLIQLKGKINMDDVSFVKLKKKKKGLFFVSYIDRI